MGRIVPPYGVLELSPEAYDEIERKLLGGGWDHVFEAGPGSAITMDGIVLVRELVKAPADAMG